MATNKELDENFIVHQKERLESLREELLRVLRGAEDRPARARLVEPALPQPLVVGARELGGAVRVRHERDGDAPVRA